MLELEVLDFDVDLDVEALTDLFVDLRTDLPPGEAFDNTVIELRDARGRLGDVIRSAEAAAISPIARWLSAAASSTSSRRGQSGLAFSEAS